MSKAESRVTTREFYKALLEIKPELQKLNSSVKRLEVWAFADSGKKCADTRLKNIESALRNGRVENRIIKAIAKVIWALLGMAAGVAANQTFQLF